MSKLREEIEAYLATFHEGADQQRYHLENFLRWREAKALTVRFRPSGMMCQACARSGDDCSRLDFASMRAMKTDRDGVTVVKCDKFENGR